MSGDGCTPAGRANDGDTSAARSGRTGAGERQESSRRREGKWVVAQVAGQGPAARRSASARLHRADLGRAGWRRGSDAQKGVPMRLTRCARTSQASRLLVVGKGRACEIVAVCVCRTFESSAAATYGRLLPRTRVRRRARSLALYRAGGGSRGLLQTAGEVRATAVTGGRRETVAGTASPRSRWPGAYLSWRWVFVASLRRAGPSLNRTPHQTLVHVAVMPSASPFPRTHAADRSTDHRGPSPRRPLD